MSLAGLLLVLFLGSVQAGDPGALAREILTDERFQTELPEGEDLVEARSDPEPRSSRSIPGALARFLFWGGLLVTAVLVAVVLYQLLSEPSRGAARAAVGRSEVRARAPTARASGPAPGGAPADPETLAAQGRHAEAIHALLLRALGSLPRGGFGPSATGREIVATVELDARRREALAGLVQAVERCLFAAIVPARADYESCVRLAAVLGAGDEG